MNKRVNKKLKIADNRPRARFRLHKSLNLLFALPKVRPPGNWRRSGCPVEVGNRIYEFSKSGSSKVRATLGI